LDAPAHEHALPAPSKLAHSVSMVAYGYNEEESIADFFNKAVAALEAVVDDYEIVFIDDCSTDTT
jgi:hypothetical protein